MKMGSPSTLTLLLALCAFFLSVTSQQPPTQQPMRYRIQEEQPIGTVIANIPTDSGLTTKYTPHQLSDLTFKFLKPRPDLAVNLTTGVITIASVIDRDAMCPGKIDCVIEVDVTVIDHQQYVRHVVKVIFQITDVNDNAPRFPRQHISESISEGTMPGILFPIQQATDLDSPEYGVAHYTLSSVSQTFELKVDSREGGFLDLHLVQVEKLDRERLDFYQLTVVAYDGGVPPKSGSVVYHIEVLDANDNLPMFSKGTYEVDVEENAAPQRSLLFVRAVDGDLGKNGEITYAFSQSAAKIYGDRFAVDRSTGMISLLRSLDYEQASSIALEVVATDSGEGAVPVTARVLVTIHDVNDNNPQIRLETSDAQSGTAANPVVYATEHCPIGTFVAHLSVTDSDRGNNGRVHCSIHTPQFQLVLMFETEYKLQTLADLDREHVGVHHVVVTCRDMGQPARSATLNVTVVVNDVNDHAPVFTPAFYNFSITENNEVHAFIGQVSAVDHDKDENGLVLYELSSDAEGMVRLDARTGILTAIYSFDRETASLLRFHVVGVDQSAERKSSSALVMLHVLDVDDETPHLLNDRYEFWVSADAPVRHEVGRLVADDLDARPHNRFTFYLNSSFNPLHAAAFSVEPYSGALLTRLLLNRGPLGGARGVYNLSVGVQSETTLPRSTDSASVIVHVLEKGISIIPDVNPFPTAHPNPSTPHIPPTHTHPHPITPHPFTDDPIPLPSASSILAGFTFPPSGFHLALLIGSITGAAILLCLVVVGVCWALAARRRGRRRRKAPAPQGSSSGEVPFWSSSDLMSASMQASRGGGGGNQKVGGKKGMGMGEGGEGAGGFREPSFGESSSEDDLAPSDVSTLEKYDNFAWSTIVNTHADRAYLPPPPPPPIDDYVTIMQASPDFKGVIATVSPIKNYPSRQFHASDGRIIPETPPRSLSKLSTFSDHQLDICGQSLYTNSPASNTTVAPNNNNRTATLDRRTIVRFQDNTACSPPRRYQEELANRLNQNAGEKRSGGGGSSFPPPPPPLDMDRFVKYSATGARYNVQA